ncbi:hypothetical protein B484DRAFT_402921 [Ochromonadaceae sp. CCMP2298]|nr:hypothetical protein B484DRAFT_402921 [Ochromonadaceae sp. CCMP2298]
MIYRRVAVVASTLSRRFSALSALSALSAHRPAHTPQAAEALADLYHIDKDSEDERVAEVAVRHLFSYDLYVGSRGGESQHTLEAFARASQFVDHFYTERDGADGAGERYEGERDERVKLVILDSGCGVGHSTIAIAHQHPDIPVIGIDKSLHRLSKSKLYEPDFAQKAQTLKRTGPEAGSIVGVGATGEAGLEAEVGVAGVGAAAAGVTGVPTLPRNALLLRAELGDFYTLSVGSDWTVHSHHLLYPNPFPKAKHLRRRWHGKRWM